MPDVFLINYQRFNNTSLPNKLKENVKCKLAVQFNNIPYNLKGVILHEGDSIENGKYFGIFSKILFDNTDNNTVDIETIKKRSQEVKTKHKIAVPCSLALQLVYFIDVFKGNL